MSVNPILRKNGFESLKEGVRNGKTGLWTSVAFDTFDERFNLLHRIQWENIRTHRTSQNLAWQAYW